MCIPGNTFALKVAPFGSGGFGLPYQRVSLRVRSGVALQLREIAKNLGWQLADLQRTLICVGATLYGLSSRSPGCKAAATTLLDGLQLLELSANFSPNPWARPYALRLPGRESELITLHLPSSVCATVAASADHAKVSRNEVYAKFLEQGLLTFLKAQATTLQTSHE